MRVQKLQLIDFKRFHDLAIDLSTRSLRIVALVGPNGSGKSSVFDAFEQLGGQFRGASTEPKYLKKSIFHDVNATQKFRKDRHIVFATDQKEYDNKSFYIWPAPGSVDTRLS